MVLSNVDGIDYYNNDKYDGIDHSVSYDDGTE